jgi:L-asparaginase
MRADRVTKVSASAYDAFDSPRSPVLGNIGIDVHFQPARRLIADHSTPLPALNLPPDGAVVLLKLYPGITTHLLRSVCADPEIKAVVLEAFGSGNGPSRDLEFLSEVRATVERGIVVLVVSQPLDGIVSFGRYAAGTGFAGAGAISGGDLTTEAAVTKLYYLLACGLDTAEIATELRCQEVA